MSITKTPHLKNINFLHPRVHNKEDSSGSSCIMRLVKIISEEYIKTTMLFFKDMKTILFLVISTVSFHSFTCSPPAPDDVVSIIFNQSNQFRSKMTSVFSKLPQFKKSSDL